MTADPLPRPDGVALISQLLDGRRVAMLVTRALDGGLAARPMALPEREFDGTLWFLAEAGSEKIAEIAADPHVNVSLLDGTYLSLNGIAEVVDDPACKTELWDEVFEQWFGCAPEEPGVTALRVDVLSAEYWEVPGHPSAVIPLAVGPVSTGRPTLTGREDVPDVER